MKVLVATRESQGEREDDFWDDCIEGEIVWMEEPCGYTNPDTAGHCTCATAFIGLESMRMTTTARVVDRPDLDRAGFRRALTDGHRARGRMSGNLAKHSVELLRIAKGLQQDKVLERWNDWIGLRFDPESGDLQAPIRVLTELVDFPD